MQSMIESATHLREVLSLAYPVLQQFDSTRANESHSPDAWSNKEILGHLIDSAANNHQKFIRLAATAELKMEGYAQDHWVDTQQYASRSWMELLDFWKGYNVHLWHLIESLDPNSGDHSLTIGNAGPFTLSFIVADYVEHLKHHLLQLAPELELTSKFTNVY